MEYPSIGTAKFAAPITPGDTAAANLPAPTKGIYVGGAGNITAVMMDGTPVLFAAVPVGTILPIQCNRVNATGTTATALVGLSN
jgi:hypothetical protein